MSNPPLLEVKNLYMHYHISDQEIVKAVSDVSFSVYEGETFGFVGESGCGKSATCRSLLRLIKPPGEILSGEILYKGQDILKLSPRAMQQFRGRQMSMIFQEPMTALNPVMKIRDQITDALYFLKNRKTEANEYAVDLLRRVGIPLPEERIKEYPHQFSGGMQQRAMIASALGPKPGLLLADEPTTALDVTIQDQIIKLINNLRDELKMSVILVTHDLGVVAQMCDRLAVMYAGRIMEMTDTVTLFSKPRHPYTYALLGSIPTRANRGKKLEPITGAPPNLANLDPGCPFKPRCRYAESVCGEELPEIRELKPGHWSRCHFLDKAESFQGVIEDYQQ